MKEKPVLQPYFSSYKEKIRTYREKVLALENAATLLKEHIRELEIESGLLPQSEKDSLRNISKEVKKAKAELAGLEDERNWLLEQAEELEDKEDNGLDLLRKADKSKMQ